MAHNEPPRKGVPLRRRRFIAGSAIALGATGSGLSISTAAVAQLSESDAAGGIRTALERGANAAVGKLGLKDGFLGNLQVRIALPGALDSAAKLLKFSGQGARVEQLVVAMNRAAEAAMPEARTLLLAAVRSMSVDDARQILAGGDDSVTRFFAAKTREPLSERLLPVITRETDKLALADKYNAVAGRAAGFGLLGKDDANIQRYVTAKALDGLYLMIGEEERKIRADPVGTGSAILKQVFGGLR